MRTNYYVIFFALIFYSFLFSEETNTIITPVLDTKIEKGKNLIFCGTFQLAWDELNQEITPDDIKLEGNPSLVEKLNNGLFSKKSISDKNHVAFAGKATKENLDKLFQKLSKFLKPEEYPNFPLEPSSYFAYSYLTKQLPFKEAFETDLNIEFQNQNISSIVEGFGISNYHSNNSKDTFLSSQLRILDYNNDDDYIIQLISEDSDDELILAKTEPKTSLFKTIRAVQKRIDNGNSSSIKSNEILKIPIIDLEVKHLFKELLEKNFENNNFKQYSIEKALQSIDFRLDEKGASLTSSSECWTVLGEVLDKRKPREFVFDKPFLMYLQEKGSDYPYLAIWIENTELFEMVTTNDLRIPYLAKNPNIGYVDKIFDSFNVPDVYQCSLFTKNNKWGIKDNLGKTIIQPVYDSLFCFKEDLALARKEKKWGYINTAGEVIINFQYEEGTSFSSGLATVRINGSWGYINKTGEITIEPQYAFAFPFYGEIARVLSDVWLLIDKKGNVIHSIGNYFIKDRYNLKKHKTMRNRIELVVATGEKKLSGLNYKPLYYTLVIEPGNSSEPCKTYDYLLHYQDKILVRKDNKSGVLNNDWQVSIPYEYDGLVGSDGNFLAAKRDSLWGIIDIKNQQLTDYGFNDAKFIDGLPCLKKNNIWSILNPFNNLDLLLEANEIHSFQSTYVSKDYIYIKGEEMSEEEIFEIQFSSDGVIIAYDDNETLGEMFAAAFGKIFATEHNPVSSEEKKEIEERTFFIKMASNIPKFEDKFLWYKLDNKMGLINAKAEIITEPIYDDIEPIDFGLGKIVQNTEVGLINYKGEIVLEPSYNTMNYFFEWYKGSKYSKILIDEKYGLIDYTGQIVINPIFDSIRIAYNYISVKQNKQWGIFDFKNNLSQNFKFSEAKINVTDFGEFSYLGYYDDSFDDSLSDCFQVTCLDGLENFSIEHKQDEKREIPISYNKKVSEKFLKNQKKRRKKFKEEIRNIPEFNDNFLWYKSDNKMGLMNLKAKIVTKPVFDDIVHIGFGLAKIVQNSKVGLINFKGEIILEPEYDTLNDFEWFGGKKYSKISLSGLFGLIDYQGNIILPMRYQEIERLENWQIMINENGIEKTIGIDELMLQEE